MAHDYFEEFIRAFGGLEEDLRELEGDSIICPPSEDYEYPSTPKNALTFGTMGVDGVHTAVIKIGGRVRNDSPVVQISPMDAKDVFVLAESFLSYLAHGCGVTVEKMEAVFEDERELHPFLAMHFKDSRLFDDAKIDKLTAKLGHYIERKNV
jgi:hypothetical protein